MTQLYQILGMPFGFVLRLIYQSIGFQNYAISIVILTFLARLLMIPSTVNQQKGMAKTQRIQSKIRKIQEKYAGDQRRIQEETQALYSREGYNPMNAGCSPLLLQFVLLFGLIGAIYYPLSNFLPGIPDSEIKILTEAVKSLGSSTMTKSTHLSELLVIDKIEELMAMNLQGVSQSTYDAIANIDFSFFGLFKLGDVPMDYKGQLHIIWIIPVLSTLSTLGSSLYSQLKQNKTGTNPAAGKSMGCMTVGMSLFSLYFVINYPAGIGIYWIASGLFGLLTNIIVGRICNPKKMMAKIMIDETVERRSKENNIKFIAANKEQK